MEPPAKGRHGGGGEGANGRGSAGTGSPAVSDPVPSAWAESRRKVDEGLVVIQTAVDLMNNNCFKQAEELLKHKSHQCMFHSLAYGTVIFLQAGFCMDREVIEKASEVLTNTVQICGRCRRSKGVVETVSSWMFGQKLDDYNPEELTAEIFHAEANLLLSFLTFLQDESLLSFVKGAIRIRNCHSTYKQLHQWLSSCEQKDLEMDPTFVSGVRMGFGCFNLFLSLLPGRVLKLLEFAGFSGDRSVGLRELELGAASHTFRAPLCTSFLLFFYTVAAVITGIQIDAEHSEALLLPQLHKYPSSVQFQYFQGRIHLMKGQVDQAMESFHAAIDCQDEWRQVKHLIWWELAWTHCMKTEWGEAARYSDMLYKESRWSKASFLYMHASFSLMELRHTHSTSERDSDSYVSADEEVASSDDVHVDGDETSELHACTGEGMATSEEPLSSNDIDEVDSGSTTGAGCDKAREDHIAALMKDIPALKQRIAGKSIPIEVFGVGKSQRYLAGARLPLCGMELMYSNNVFVLLRNNQVLLRQLIAQVEEELKLVNATQGENAFYASDMGVCYLVKGCLLRVLGEYEDARESLLSILAVKTELQSDVYCLPAALAELALLYLDTGAELEEAERVLEEARTQYKNYVLENRIHFRIHEAKNRIAACKEKQ